MIQTEREKNENRQADRVQDGSNDSEFKGYADDTCRSPVFRWSSLYLWGWCKDREDFRLSKLNRMDGVQEMGEVLESQEARDAIAQMVRRMRMIYKEDTAF